MIQANELRIGNIVANTEGNLATVGEWHTITAECFTDPFLKLYVPVTLTEEILLGAGFNNVLIKGMYKHPIHDQWQMFLSDNEWIFRATGSSMVKVKSLHHFQNIWHSLTGKELEIKL